MAVAVRILVLCPLRREMQLALFTDARLPFLCLGIAAASICRLQGIDLARATPRDRAPKPCMVVSRALLRDFAPAARAIFEQKPRVRYVWFVEDDCRVQRGVSLLALLEACSIAGGLRKIAWLGFRTSGGEPKIGAHLLSFSRGALTRFLGDVAKVRSSNTLALDTLLHALWKDGRVWTPEKSMATQTNHALKGHR